MSHTTSKRTNQRRRENLRATARRRLRVENLEERRLLAVVAADGFESGNFAGGSEQWDSGSWVASGDATVRSDTSPASGSQHARLRRSTGDLQRTVDVTDLTNVRLQFSAKLISFEGSDRADVRVSGDGTNWTTIQSFFDGDDDGQYHEFDLAVPDVGDTLHIRFDAGMSGRGDYWYIDNVQVTGVQAGPPTVSIGDATGVEGDNALREIDRFVAEASGGLSYPSGLILGPDSTGDGEQELYVVSQTTNEILRFDGATGAFVDAFVTGETGLVGPKALRFSPVDGDLYVSSDITNEVLRFDGVTGSYVNTPVSGLAKPMGLSFAADGSLLIANQDTDEVLRYDEVSLSAFVSSGSGGLDRPRVAVLGPDGNGDGSEDLYVASHNTNQVLRYDGQTGAFIDVFSTIAGVAGPNWLQFGTDGILYATSRNAVENLERSIVRIDAATGTVLDTTNLGRDGWSFVLGPDNLIYSSSNSSTGNFVARVAPESWAALTISLSTASSVPVTVEYGTSDGSAIAGADYAATSGTVTFSPGETTRTIIVKTIDDSDVESDETFIVSLSNAVGATILDGNGTGTIADDDAAREITIGDAIVTEGGSTLQDLGFFVTEGSGGSIRPRTNAFGPDRNGDSVEDLYVISANTDEVLVYDGSNGSFIEPFITGVPELDGSADMAFGDGYLFANSLYDLGKVFRFDAQTGAYLDSIDVGTVGPLGITFVESGPYTGDLFITDRLTNEVLRYDFDTDTVSPFVTAGSGGIVKPWKAIVGPDDNLYVTSNGTNQVLKYDGLTGDFLDVIATDVLATAVWLDFNSDGYLYLSGRNSIDPSDTTGFAQIDVNTNSVLQTYGLVGEGGHYFSIGPDNVLYISGGSNGNHVLRAGPSSVASFEVTLSSVSSLPVTVDFSTSGASATSGMDYTATNGTIVFEPGVTTRTIVVPTLNDSDVESEETFAVNLSNAVGASIADASAVGTIIDDEVPNMLPAVDAGADQTLSDADASGVELVTLVGTASDSDGSVASVQWTEGATVLGNATTLTTPLSVGVHTLTFTASDNEGASSSDTVVVTVNPNQGPTADAGSNITVSDADDNGSELVTLNGAGSDTDGTIASYQWSEGSTVLGTSSSISPVLTVGTHVLTLTVTDNGGATASDSVVVTVEQPSSETALYVYDIRFESYRSGRYRRAIFEIRSDSNSDGQGSSADAAAAGVAITVQFDGRTYSGTTDSNGLFATSWRKNVSSGTYAEVVDLALTDFYWDPLALDLEDDTDGDGLPDARV